ncbi:MAG TPA: TolC family protein, partial [Gallionella sp.]|nr:TolC family protein [Gallionella sp.]
TAGSRASSSSVTLTQPLLRNGGIDANTASVRIARIDEQINLLNLRSTISQTVVQIVYAYRELLRAQEQRTIAEAALKRSRELYEVNKALIAAGRMAEVEIIQTEAQVANQEVALEEANNQIDASRLALLNLLALEPSAAVVASSVEINSAKGPDVARALAVALDNQPDYLASQLSIERAKINLDYAKNQRLWDVSLIAGQSRTQGNGAAVGGGAGLTATSKSSFAGVQLSVPLGDRSLDQAVVSGSVELKSQNLRALDARQVLEQRVRDAVRNVQTRWRQLELSKKARELTVLKLDAEKEKLKVGRSSNFQILTFEGDLRNAENAQLNAQIAYLNALTDLDDRMGKILDAWRIPIVETADLPTYEN